MKIIRDHDALFRFVFGDPEQMAELLRAQLPSAIADVIDWSTLRRLEGSFVDETLQDRETDIVFEARMGTVAVLLYVVSEHKSKDERLTSWQLARYVVRVVDRWLLDHPGAKTLPAVLPFVLHHGDRPWQAPRTPRDLVDLQGCSGAVEAFLRPLQMDLPFVLLDLAAASEEAIEAMRVSAVTGLTLRFLQFLRRLPPEVAVGRILGWQRLVASMLEHHRGQDVLVALLSWWFAGAPANKETLRTVMAKINEKENRPMRSMLDLVLEMGEERGLKKGEKRGVKRGVKQGVKRGVKQGVLVGQRELLAEQLTSRFGDLPAFAATRLAAADALSLRLWGQRVLTAPTLAAVFAVD